MELSVQGFNRLLAELRASDIPVTIEQTSLSETINETSDAALIQLYNVGRQPRFPQLTIYFPVSRYDEFPPSPVSFVTNRPISAKDLLESIQAQYRTRLPPASIQAYLQTDPEIYDFLQEERSPILRDAMVELIFIEGLEPYQDGYLLQLAS